MKNSHHYADSVLPVGSICWGASLTTPQGWLICNGQAVSRSQYPELFRILLINFGAGDGNLTFNLPNLRFVSLLGDSDGAATIGKTGGNFPVILTKNNMPIHDHYTGGNNVDHAHSGSTATEGAHSHTYDAINEARNTGSRRRLVGASADTAISNSFAGNHYHTFTTGFISANHRHYVNSAGNSAGFDARMPTILLRPLIRAF